MTLTCNEKDVINGNYLSILFASQQNSDIFFFEF